MGTNSKKGIVFDIKKYATDDGPGIRTTIFFKGCPLRCWWCHNPEGQEQKPELMYKRKRCIRCGECVNICPRGAIALGPKQVSINRKLCDVCGRCSKECPTGALTIIGKEMSLVEVSKEIEKDMIFYKESGGGITVSGGEPLFQVDFLNAVLEDCREKDISTAVDTSGYALPSALEKIGDKVDLFLFDVKVMDDKTHKKYTGVSNKLILANLKRLVENGSDILIRLPIIPGINDGGDNVSKTAQFALSMGIENLSLLPYHRAGIEKYKSLNRPYKLMKTQAPSDQNLRLIKERFETFGLKVKIGGG